MFILTFDIEEWYRNDFPGNDPQKWSDYDDRIELEIPLALQLLKKYKQRATFFVLGVVARKHPVLIKKVAHAGHELASHGMYHRKVRQMSRKEFHADAQESRVLLQSLTKQPVVGFRAPYWSVTTTHPAWYYPELIACGYRYSSSIFPINLSYYGDGLAPIQIATIPIGKKSITEIPASCYQFGVLKIPVAAGVFLRYYPLAVTRWLIKTVARRSHVMIVFHNWELDPYQPILPIAPLYYFGHYGFLKSGIQKLENLLKSYHFTSIKSYLVAK
jgi:polysaccharide deacetylase family protein (PEP-CTERM system associated)